MQLQQYVDSSPTAWHACSQSVAILKKAGFTALDEQKPWNIKSGASYYTLRNDGSLIAFIMPQKKPAKAHVVVAHTDSPGLRLKPQGEYEQEGCTLLHFEVYGSPILPTWIGRDLYLAGRVFFEHKGVIESALIECKDKPFIIANLALHLDRQVNDTGLAVKKQDDLSAIVSSQAAPFLAPLLKKLVKGQLLHHELFAVPCEDARIMGVDGELLASPRLDNLASCLSSLEALCRQKASADTLKIVALFNHEEIGSTTQEGAASTFFDDVLERICSLTKEEYACFKAKSSTISCDVGHALHPTHADRHDARHPVYLGEGPIVKTNAQCRYVTDALLASQIVQCWNKKKIPFQYFSARNDIPCGSTIGPIHAAKTGFKTIDMGIPLLGMHACREVININDYSWFTDGLEAYLNL